MACCFQRGLRAFQVDHGGAQAKVVVDQFLLVLLDAGDVGADRDVAAILGAALGDVQPAAVVELRLEGARARRLRRGFLQPGADLRHAADLDHGLIGRARRDRGIRQPVQPLEMRVAQHQAVFGVPQHEGLGDGFDGVAQPQIGFHGPLGETLLLGDIDGDADQMQAAVVAAFIVASLAEFAAHPQPDPVAVGVLHPEGLVDVVDFRGDQLVGDGEQVDVVGFHQRVDLAEGQKVAAAFQSQHGEHRLRPEYPAARQVPVPQAAASAIERGVDAAAHGVVDEVAFAGAGGLPVEGKAQYQHHEAGGGGQRHRQRRVRSPQRLDLLLNHDHLAGQSPDQAQRRQRAAAIGQDHVADAALLAGQREKLRRADDVENPVGVAKLRIQGDAGENPAVGAGDEDMASRSDAPRWNELGQQFLQALDRSGAVRPDRADAIEALGEQIGQRRHIPLHRGALLPALVDHLNEGADADGDQESDDEGRDRAAERGFRDQRAMIGRFRDRLRQSLDRIGLDARARRVCARHAFDPLELSSCYALRRKHPVRFRITAI